MGAAKAIFAVIGTGVKMAGNGFEAEDKAAANSRNLASLRGDAALEDSAAADAVNRGGIQAGRTRMAGSGEIAKQGLAYSASGVDATVGTPSDTAAGSALFNELDAKTIENNATREAFGHKRMAADERRKGDAVANSMNNAQRDYAMAEVGTVLGGAGSAMGGEG